VVPAAAQGAEGTTVVAGEDSPEGPHINVVAVDEVTCHSMHRILMMDGSSICNDIRIHDLVGLRSICPRSLVV